MTTSIVKRYTFEAAHRLGLGYVGKCSDMHGHSYKVHIEIQAFQLDKFGMVVDFGDLKELKQRIMQAFDHKTILQEDDVLIEPLRAESGYASVYTTKENPTCETIALIIMIMAMEELARIFPDNLIDDCATAPRVIAVSVQETETGSATAENIL